jgi:hypothetical protein
VIVVTKQSPILGETTIPQIDENQVTSFMAISTTAAVSGGCRPVAVTASGGEIR